MKDVKNELDVYQQWNRRLTQCPEQVFQQERWQTTLRTCKLMKRINKNETIMTMKGIYLDCFYCQCRKARTKNMLMVNALSEN